MSQQTQATGLNGQRDGTVISIALDQLSKQVAADLATLFGGQPGGSVAFKARAVVTSLAANTGTTTGTLTGSVNGALATQDGVTTLGVGDTVFIPPGTTNLAAASDAGPYQISSLGAAGAKWVLARPSWWATGAVAALGQSIAIGGEGTKWGGSEWRSFAAEGSAVIDTNDLVFYPRVSSAVTGAAVSGVTPANSTLWVAPQAVVVPVLKTPGTAEGTWRITTQTPGYPGTSSIVATSSAGTETSTVQLNVFNF